MSRSFWLLAAFAVTLLSAPLHAGDVEQARADFARGSELARAMQWSEALASFEKSEAVRPHPITMFNIAFCERALGAYTRSRKHFRAALSVHETGPDKLSAELFGRTPSLLDEVQAKIGRVDVTAVGVTVTIDGGPLEQAGAPGELVMVAGTLPPGPPGPVPSAFVLEASLGRHDVVVEKGGRVHRFVLEVPGDPVTFALPDQASVEPVPVVPAPVTAAKSPSVEPAPTQHAGRSGLIPGAVASFSVGGAGLVAAIVGGTLAFHHKSALDTMCADKLRCPATAQSDIDGMEVAATVSTVGVVVAAVGAAVGLGLLVAGDDGAVEVGAVRVRAGLASLGLEVSF